MEWLSERKQRLALNVKFHTADVYRLSGLEDGERLERPESALPEDGVNEDDPTAK